MRKEGIQMSDKEKDFEITPQYDPMQGLENIYLLGYGSIVQMNLDDDHELPQFYQQDEPYNWEDKDDDDGYDEAYEEQEDYDEEDEDDFDYFEDDEYSYDDDEADSDDFD